MNPDEVIPLIGVAILLWIIFILHIAVRNRFKNEEDE